MRIFKNTWFDRFAEKEGITDSGLKEAVKLLEADQSNANLGGGVYKVRVARQGEGKAGGYRTVVFFRSGERAFFAYGFAKSDRGNINQRELRIFKERAKDALSFTDEQIEGRLRSRDWLEVSTD